MKCAYSNCTDTVTKPLVCKGCNQATYCSNNCRVQDFYKGHNKLCKTKSPIRVSPSPPPESINLNASLSTEKFKSDSKVSASLQFNDESLSKSSKNLKKSTKKNLPEPEPKPNPLSAYNLTNKILGTGAYGQVKLAVHKATQQNRAIKIINKQSLEEEENGQQIVREEILTHKQLSHQNIISYFEDFEDSESIFIVLEFAESGSLFEKIKKEKKIAESEAKELFKQTVNGIQYMHLNSKIHRDLKPENILLSKNGCVKICDLGWCGKGGESRKTFCGTLDYMAPEMVRGQAHSYEVDIWALGVLLYEMLHGYAPFEGMREVEKIQNIVQGKLKFEEGISEEAKNLIQKMIKVSPKDRIRMDQILNDSFFMNKEKTAGIKVGDEFRYYVQNYGMDDGIIEEINKNECLVGFKKSGMKMKLSVDEIKRRINRKARGENSESVGNVMKLRDMYEKGNSNVMDSLGEKLKKLAQEEEENEEIKDNIRERNVKINALKIENEIKHVEEVKKVEKINRKEIEEKKVKKEEVVEDKGNIIFKKPEIIAKSEKTEEKINKNPPKSEEKTPKSPENFSPIKSALSPSPQKPDKTSPFPNNKNMNPATPSFLNPKGADSIFARLSQLAEEEEEEAEGKNPLDSIISESKPIESNPKPKILDSLSQFPEPMSSDYLKSSSKYPQYFKALQNPTPPPEKSESPPREFTPVLNTNTFAPSEAQMQKEYNIYSSLDAYIKAPVGRKRTKKSNNEKKRDKSLDKSLDNFVKKYTEQPVFFQAAKEPAPRKSSPKFADEEKNRSSGSDDNIFMKKLRKNFEKPHEAEHPFPVKPVEKAQKSPKSPKFPIDLNPDNSDHSPSKPIFSKQEKKILRKNNKSPARKGKNKDFDMLRDEIETNHANYYNNIEESWIGQQNVVKASEMNDDDEMEEQRKPRTFSQYDEVLKNPPSIVGNFEDFSDYQITKEKLESQKRELEEIIAKMEKEKNVPIKIRRDKKQKEGFLSWLGDIIGCSDRY